MSISQSPFGKTPDGRAIEQYTLTNRHGLTAKLIPYGARVTELLVPDRDGKSANVMLGFDNLPQYLADKTFQGATIGRFANRIARGRFTLDGVEYHLPLTHPACSLHGGERGFDTVVWKAEPINDNSLRFSYLSLDGDQGYPGNLQADVTVTLSDENELRFDFHALTDKATPVNMTHHGYFNLAGAGSGTILDHMLTIHADKYTPLGEGMLPTGEIAPVAGTPLDFTTPHAIGERIAQVGGYDLNYVLRSSDKLFLAAVAHDPKSGRTMEVLTSQPGVQLYSGNFLDGNMHGLGGSYVKHGAFCLETQHFPDSPNHANFPSTILRPGEKYQQVAVYRFRAK